MIDAFVWNLQYLCYIRYVSSQFDGVIAQYHVTNCDSVPNFYMLCIDSHNSLKFCIKFDNDIFEMSLFVAMVTRSWFHQGI